MRNPESHDAAATVMKRQDVSWWRCKCMAVLVPAFLLLLYALFLSRFIYAGAGPADTSGYYSCAQLLFKGSVTTAPRVIPGANLNADLSRVFMPYGFLPVEAGKMAPTYPFGMPLAIAAVGKIIGWDAAPEVVIIAFSLAGLLAIALLAREWGLPWIWAWFASLALAVCPLYITYSLQLMSDMPALVCVTLAVLFASKSRSHALWALASGVMVSFAVLVRPNNAIIFLPVALCLGVNWRRWLLLGIGGLPGALLFFRLNISAYGHVVGSGYEDVNAMFGWYALMPSLRHYMKWLPILLTPLGLLAVGLPWMVRRSPRPALVLILWILAYLGFFAFDKYTSMTWWFLRFVLPMFPACIVGGLWVLRNCLQAQTHILFTSKLFRTVLVVTAATLVMWNLYWGRKLTVCEIGKPFFQSFATAAHWCGDHIPENAAIVSRFEVSGTLYCYAPQIILRREMLTPSLWRQIAEACSKANRPIYAMTFLQSKEDFGNNLAGNWTEINRFYIFTFWRFDGFNPAGGG